MDPIALAAALASATGFALSTSLQHHAAGTAPDGSAVLEFVRHLVSRPAWLVGQVLALCSFFLHAVALHFGAIAVVQPIVVSGIVIAVPVRALMSRRTPSRDEVTAVLATTAGLAVFLIATDPSEGLVTTPSVRTFAVYALIVALAAVTNALSGRAVSPRRKAGLLGVTAGALFGVVAGLVKVVIDTHHDRGLGGLLLTWPLWLLLVCGAFGIVSNQRAYRIASLSASLPVLNIVNVVVALLLGLLVFDEVPRHTPTALGFQALALLTVGLGLGRLARVEEVQEEAEAEAEGRA